jgi:hypothetical protein
MTANPHHDRRLAASNALAEQARTDHPTVTLPAEHVAALAEAFGVALIDAIDGHIGAMLLTRDGRGVHLVSEAPRQCRCTVHPDGVCVLCGRVVTA